MSVAVRVGALPNLVVIGAAKCATTSLHAYLDAHPEIAMARPSSAVSGTNDDAPKEMRFFWRDDWRNRLEWYASHFDPDAPVRGEATPAYSAYPFHSGVAPRIAEVAPDARLIYLVRDPVDRLVAHWVQARVDARVAPLRELVARPGWERHQIACPSRYATQIRQYLDYFPRNQILVVEQQDLRERRDATLASIFTFLDVDPAVWATEFAREQNTRAEKFALTPWGGPVYRRVLDPAGRRLAPEAWRTAAPHVRRRLARPVERPVLDDESRRRIVDVLGPEAEAFRVLVGQPLDGWSV